MTNIGQKSNDQATEFAEGVDSANWPASCTENEKTRGNKNVADSDDSSDDSWMVALGHAKTKDDSKGQSVESAGPAAKQQSLMDEGIDNVFVRRALELYEKRSDTLASGKVPSLSDDLAFALALLGLGLKVDDNKASAEEDQQQPDSLVPRASASPSGDRSNELASNIVYSLLSGVVGNVDQYFENVSLATMSQGLTVASSFAPQGMNKIMSTFPISITGICVCPVFMSCSHHLKTKICSVYM